jgi:hypothetical protein
LDALHDVKLGTVDVVRQQRLLAPRRKPPTWAKNADIGSPRASGTFQFRVTQVIMLGHSPIARGSAARYKLGVL